MFYWVKTHVLVIKIFRNFMWKIPSESKKVYLTFDDGPTPAVTAWVLKELKKYNAKATFFCIGENIEKYPTIFEQILLEKHAIGNHTNNHLNGWKTSLSDYISNTTICESAIEKWSSSNNNTSIFEKENDNNLITNKQKTKLFRPPYGKLKPYQAKAIRKLGYKIVMWDVLSADFDERISSEKCLQNVLKNVNSGSIVIFHDSEKAFKNLEYVLPKTLQYLSEKGFQCEAISSVINLTTALEPTI